MPPSFRAATFAFFVMGAATCLNAQAPRTVIPGARVRVTTSESVRPNRDRFVATVVTVGPDSLTLVDEALLQLAIPIGRVVKLERSLGRQRGSVARTVKVAGIGFLVGAVLSAPLGVRTYLLQDNTGNGAAVATALLFGGGVVVGALVGSRQAVERWESVPVERIGLGLESSLDGRLGFGLHVLF